MLDKGIPAKSVITVKNVAIFHLLDDDYYSVDFVINSFLFLPYESFDE